MLENEQNQEDNAENGDVPLSFLEAFKRLSALGLPTALSYTFSLMLVFLVYLYDQLYEDTEHRAAPAVITTYLNAVNLLGISVLFAMSMVAGRALGEYQKNQRHLLNLEEQIPAEALADETEGEETAISPLESSDDTEGEETEISPLESSDDTEGEGTQIPLLPDEDVDQEEQVVVLEVTATESSQQALVLRERMAELTEEVAEVYRMGMMVSIPAAIGTVGAITFAEPLLVYVFRQDEAVARASAEFILPYGLLTLGAIFPRIGAEQMMFAFGRTVPAMVIGLSNFLVSMGIGTSLAFGYFGLPRLGLTGALIGCVTDSYLTATGFSLYIAKHPDFKDYAFFNLRRPLRPYLTQFKSMLHIGLSFLFTISTELVTSLGTTMVAGVVSTEAGAALSAAMQYTLFTFLLQAALGQCTAQEMSRLLGEGHYRRAQSFGLYSLLSTSIYITPIPVLFAAYPDLLIRLLNENNPTVQGMLRTSLPWLALASVVDSVRYSMLQQVRVLGDRNYVAASTSTGFLMLGLIISGVLGIYTSLGFGGVVAGFNIGMLLSTIALFYHWITKNQPAAMQQAEIEARLPAEPSATQQVEAILPAAPSRSSLWTGLSSLFSTPREPQRVSLREILDDPDDAFVPT